MKNSLIPVFAASLSSNLVLAAWISSPSVCNDDIVKNGVALHLPQVKPDETKVIIFVPRFFAKGAKHAMYVHIILHMRLFKHG